MPSFTGTPLQLSITGGEATFEPARLSGSPLQLSIAGAQAILGPGTGSTSLTTVSLSLDRLQRQGRYFNADGTPTTQMQLHWQRHCEALEAFAARITAQVNDNANLLAQILAANALAAAANDNATETQARTSLADSYTDPVNVLTAANDGSISVEAHSRAYGDGTSVSVNAGSVTGFSGGDYVTVFYKDAGREGGAVTYQGTTSAVAQKDAVHIVGQVTIPASGEPPASGGGTTAPGYSPPPSGSTSDPNYVEP